jgi:hypothetical protein
MLRITSGEVRSFFLRLTLGMLIAKIMITKRGMPYETAIERFDLQYAGLNKVPLSNTIRPKPQAATSIYSRDQQIQERG